jgi:hypothetical protein
MRPQGVRSQEWSKNLGWLELGAVCHDRVWIRGDDFLEASLERLEGRPVVLSGCERHVEWWDSVVFDPCVRPTQVKWTSQEVFP